ncbi:MAG: glycosyltransferase family 39 protein [Candidatus Shapirobacteria bacterium]
MAGASLALIIIGALVNLIGALGPELSFDALFYHLTLPKLYLLWGKMPVIPGGLLYASGQPGLMELIYTGALALQGEILAKIIHWAFGLLCAFLLYKVLRRFYEVQISLLGVMIFYLTPVVGWLSITAYVDLAVVFFELLALNFFILWFQKRKDIFLYPLGIALGFSLSIKFLSWGSLFIYLIILIIAGKSLKRGIVAWLKIILPALLVSFPWYLRTYLYTGNPFYPLFTDYARSAYPLIERSFLKIFFIPWEFTFLSDSLFTPIFLIFLPLALIGLIKRPRLVKIISLLSFFQIIYWFFTPAHSIRYLLPFTPPLIIFILSVFCLPFCDIKIKEKLEKVLISSVFFVSLLHLGIRSVSNVKFLPVILGRETKSEFLTQNLNFRFGDFYDTDGYFQRNITKDDQVLIYGIHNLYYVDFPFAHESWASFCSQEEYTYVLLGNDAPLPKKYASLPLIYGNSLTGVKLYKVANEKN